MRRIVNNVILFACFSFVIFALGPFSVSAHQEWDSDFTGCNGDGVLQDDSNECTYTVNVNEPDDHSNYSWSLDGEKGTDWEVVTSGGNGDNLEGDYIKVRFINSNNCGSFEATVEYTDGDGSSASLSKTLNPTDCGSGGGGVGADAVIQPQPESVCSGITLDGNKSCASSGSQLTKCEWDFGNDGDYDVENTSVTKNGTCDYSGCKAVDYVPEGSSKDTVVLRVTDDSGESATSPEPKDLPMVKAEASVSSEDKSNRDFTLDVSGSCTAWNFSGDPTHFIDMDNDGSFAESEDVNRTASTDSISVNNVSGSGEKTVSYKFFAPDKEGVVSDIEIFSNSSSGADASFSCSLSGDGTADCQSVMTDSSYSYTWDFISDPSIDCVTGGVTETGEDVIHKFSQDQGTVRVCLEVINKSDSSDKERVKKDLVITGGNISGNIPNAQGGLVPCSGVSGVNGAEKCTFEDLIILVQNLIDFLITIGTVIAMLVFAYAGFLYLTAGGDSNQVSRAHSVFRKVIFGFVIMLVAWLVVNTILAALNVPEAYDLLG